MLCFDVLIRPNIDFLMLLIEVYYFIIYSRQKKKLLSRWAPQNLIKICKTYNYKSQELNSPKTGLRN